MQEPKVSARDDTDQVKLCGKGHLEEVFLQAALLLLDVQHHHDGLLPDEAPVQLDDGPLRLVRRAKRPVHNETSTAVMSARWGRQGPTQQEATHMKPKPRERLLASRTMWWLMISPQQEKTVYSMSSDTS